MRRCCRVRVTPFSACDCGVATTARANSNNMERDYARTISRNGTPRTHMDKVRKAEAEWQAQLTPEEYAVVRRKGTERPFTRRYSHTTDHRIYRRAGCGTA